MRQTLDISKLKLEAGSPQQFRTPTSNLGHCWSGRMARRKRQSMHAPAVLNPRGPCTAEGQGSHGPFVMRATVSGDDLLIRTGTALMTATRLTMRRSASCSERMQVRPSLVLAWTIILIYSMSISWPFFGFGFMSSFILVSQLSAACSIRVAPCAPDIRREATEHI